MKGESLPFSLSLCFVRYLEKCSSDTQSAVYTLHTLKYVAYVDVQLGINVKALEKLFYLAKVYNKHYLCFCAQFLCVMVIVSKVYLLLKQKHKKKNAKMLLSLFCLLGLWAWFFLLYGCNM